jgi:hypothetical protein
MPVLAVRVTFSEEKGWHGGTDTLKGSADHLQHGSGPILRAGKIAEEFFDCPAHQKAWLGGFFGEISALLDRNGIRHERDLWLRIAEADERARAILQSHRDKALKLIDRLVECGRVERPEFLRLMNGETL